MSVTISLKKSLPGSTFSTACNIHDCWSRNLDANWAGGEIGEYIGLERLARYDRSPVLYEELFCNDSAKYFRVMKQKECGAL